MPEKISSNMIKSSIKEGRPICGCKFLVAFDYFLKVPFSRVSGISEEKQVKYIREGGRNDTPLMFKCPQENGVKLTFERGFVSKNYAGFFTDMLLMRKRMVYIEIFVLNPDSSVAKTYMFQSQGMVSWSLGDLDASRSEVLIEKLVLSTTGLM